MKSELFLVSVAVAAMALPGCKSSKPVGTEGGATGGEIDYTSMGELPPRGDFNPESDVDYAAMSSATNASNIIYFASDSSTLQPSERGKLDKIHQWMNNNPARSILVAGHCDDRGTLEYNRALGERRAIAVRDYLIGLGAAGQRVYTHSYGEERPASQGSGESAWSKNRRAEIGVVAR